MHPDFSWTSGPAFHQMTDRKLIQIALSLVLVPAALWQTTRRPPSNSPPHDNNTNWSQALFPTPTYFLFLLSTSVSHIWDPPWQEHRRQGKSEGAAGRHGRETPSPERPHWRDTLAPNLLAQVQVQPTSLDPETPSTPVPCMALKQSSQVQMGQQYRNTDPLCSHLQE
jgi:hypothetical protein